MQDLKTLVARVREADKVYWDNTRSAHTPTYVVDSYRKVMTDARRTLRDAIYDATGVNIDELKKLTQG